MLDRQVPPEFRVAVYEFLEAAAGIYESEKDRDLPTSEHLRGLFNANIKEIVIKESRSSNDGCIVTAVHGSEYEALRLLLELKNEIGSGGCDPSVQGPYSTRKFWVATEVCVGPYKSKLLSTLCIE
jgi:hypothetical protein